MTKQTLDEIMSGRSEPVSETVETGAADTAQTETHDEGQGRDASGRFATKQGDQTQTTEAAQVDDTGDEPPRGQVPHQALHAEKERRRKETERADGLERQMAEMRAQMDVLIRQGQAPLQAPKPVEPPKKVEFWEDPNAFVQQALTPIQEQNAALREQVSQANAIAEYGKDTVTAAFQAMGEALGSDPRVQADYQRIMQAPHPYGELINWHRNRTVLSEVGADPAAYKERLRQEIMAEMQASHQQQPQTATAPRLPGNFAAARSEGPRSGAAYTGPKPLSEITKGNSQ